MSYERDRLDILDLLGRYAHAYDSGDREMLNGSSPRMRSS